MGHGGEKISLCLIGGFGIPGRDLKAPIQVKHIDEVKEEQYQQTGGNDSNQQPVFLNGRRWEA